MKQPGEPIKVAMILNSPGFGGVPKVAETLACRLDRTRFKPMVYFLKGLSSNRASCHAQLCTLDSQGIPYDGATDGIGKIDVIAELSDWIFKQRVDVVHTHSYRPNLYGRMAARLSRRVSIISHYHNQYDDKWCANPTSVLLEKQLAATTDAMIAVSASVRDHICARIGIDSSRIAVLGNGVEAKRFADTDRSAGRKLLKLSADVFTIGLIGRVCHQKGTDLFVDAAISMATTRSNTHFLIVGNLEDNALYQELLKRIDAAGLSHQIRFTDHIGSMELVYAALDMVVAPSRWEGFGLALVEAMAAGVPVVANPAGAIPMLTQGSRAAYLVPSNHPADLSKAMAELHNDGDRREELSRAGRRRAADFCWQPTVDALSCIYERVSLNP